MIDCYSQLQVRMTKHFFCVLKEILGGLISQNKWLHNMHNRNLGMIRKDFMLLNLCFKCVFCNVKSNI